MAYQLVQPNFYTQQVNLPLSVTGQNFYGLRYDPKTGDYELKQKNAFGGYDVGIGLAILYKNGSWTSDAIQDSKLFENNDPNKPTALANQLSQLMRQKVYQAYKNIGGAAGGNKVNKTATPDKFTEPAGVNNFFPGTNPWIATAVPGGTILSAPPGSLPLFSDPLDFPSVNAYDLFGSKQVAESRLLIYPVDILETQQDTVRFTQYEYTSPSGADLFKPDNAGNIVINGLQRASAAKKDPKGTVILPIPGGIGDRNETSWAEDSMNNLTAGILSSVLANLPAAAGGAVLGNLIGQLRGINPTQAIALADLLAKLPPDVANNGPALDNIRAAIASMTMKSAGFEVAPEQILARGKGLIPNSNLELLFNKPTLRTFDFGFKMSPRSEREAKNIRRIIRFFKQGMAARKFNAAAGAGGASAFLGTPNIFKIQYKTANDASIPGLNKFKLCALTGCAVNYGPSDMWAAFEGGQPVTVSMGLSFAELEPIYESDYQSDLADAFKDAPDLESIGPDDVGY